MLYTAWSRGRLLGVTRLEGVFRENGFRSGAFYPTALGETFMERATAISPAVFAVERAMSDRTAWADLAAACDAERALDLQLRDPDGSVIETQDLWITDDEFAVSVAEQCADEPPSLDQTTLAGVDGIAEETLADWEQDEPWRPEPEPQEYPRYQIHVVLAEGNAAP